MFSSSAAQPGVQLVRFISTVCCVPFPMGEFLQKDSVSLQGSNKAPLLHLPQIENPLNER